MIGSLLAIPCEITSPHQSYPPAVIWFNAKIRMQWVHEGHEGTRREEKKRKERYRSADCADFRRLNWRDEHIGALDCFRVQSAKICAICGSISSFFSFLRALRGSKACPLHPVRKRIPPRGDRQWQRPSATLSSNAQYAFRRTAAPSQMLEPAANPSRRGRALAPPRILRARMENPGRR